MSNILKPTEFYNEKTNNLAIEIEHYTPQLFSVLNHSKCYLSPYPDSSLVLIAVSGKHFLVTSGHSVHNVDLDKFGIMLENEFYRIGGQLKYFEPNEQSVFNLNKADIVVF